MEDRAKTKGLPNTVIDHEAVLTQMLAEMQHWNEQMEAARNRLRAETDAQKAETTRLRVESQASLARLSAVP